MSIGSKKIVQIALVVRDIEASKRKWGALFGLEPFQEFQVPTWPEAPSYTDGVPSDASDVKAVKFLLSDNMMLALFQPGEKPTPWKKHLDAHGESVFFLELQPEKQDAALQSIREVCGAAEPQHIEYQKGVAYAIMPTAESLGVDLNLILPQTDGELVEKVNAEPEKYAKLPEQVEEKSFSRRSKISALLANEQATAVLERHLPELFASGKLALAGMLDLETVCGFCVPPISAESMDQMEKELAAIQR